jgi:hypothetical protein
MILDSPLAIMENLLAPALQDFENSHPKQHGHDEHDTFSVAGA